MTQHDGGLGDPTTGVVVTGGASGIGRACALALAAVGRPVGVWDLDAAGAVRVAGECSALGVAAHAVALDVRDDAAVAAAVEPTLGALGAIGGLVHAAGMVAPALVDVVDVETWDAVLGVNLRAEAIIVAALLPALRAAGPGSAVVGISSIEGLVGHGAIPSYVASKHALIGLTRALAHRLGPERIRVNVVCPGYVETPMLAPSIASPETRRSFEAKVPLGRLAQPDDVARVVRFLLSEEAAYVHGAVVVVDGGVIAVGGQESLGAAGGS